MTKSRAWFGGLVAAVALQLVTGCAGITHHKTTSPSVVRHLDASWADGYTTIAGMARHADLVVEGVVSGVAGRGQFHNGLVNLLGAPDGAVPSTDFDFVVSAVMKGSQQVGAVITIRQTGGQASDGSTVEISDDPLLEIGSRAVLFLKRFAADSYFIMGGPAGRFSVSSGGSVTELPGSPVIDAPRAHSSFVNKVRSAA